MPPTSVGIVLGSDSFALGGRYLRSHRLCRFQDKPPSFRRVTRRRHTALELKSPGVPGGYIVSLILRSGLQVFNLGLDSHPVSSPHPRLSSPVERAPDLSHLAQTRREIGLSSLDRAPKNRAYRVAREGLQEHLVVVARRGRAVAPSGDSGQRHVEGPRYERKSPLPRILGKPRAKRDRTRGVVGWSPHAPD